MTDVADRPWSIKVFSPSMTKQSFAEECDINCILERARQGMDISSAVNNRVALYGDFTSVPSYQDALDLVNRANGMFMSLDATVRERFANDPSRMIAFLQDVRNYDEAVKLGLVVPKAPVVESPGSPELTAQSRRASSDSKSTKAKPAGDME